jgi:hypothetical protein
LSLKTTSNKLLKGAFWSCYNDFFFVISSLLKGIFYILINVKYLKKKQLVRRPHVFRGHLGGRSTIKSYFSWFRLNLLGAPSAMGRRVFQKPSRFGSNGFFFPFLLSLLLDFHISPLRILEQPFNFVNPLDLVNFLIIICFYLE